jgi:hypothetical protein
MKSHSYGEYVFDWAWAEAFDLGHGESAHADLGQRFAHFVELERLEYRLDFLHAEPPSL